jgi:hypothetical protein
LLFAAALHPVLRLTERRRVDEATRPRGAAVRLDDATATRRKRHECQNDAPPHAEARARAVPGVCARRWRRGALATVNAGGTCLPEGRCRDFSIQKMGASDPSSAASFEVASDSASLDASVAAASAASISTFAHAEPPPTNSVIHGR